MGSGSFNPGAYRAFSTGTVGKKTEDIFTSRNLHKSLDPKGVKIRESRDSADNPNSTPLIVAIDVTGSVKTRSCLTRTTPIERINSRESCASQSSTPKTY